MKEILIFVYSFIGLEKIVQMLIDKGANVNAVDVKNNSALFYAAKNGNILNQFFQNTMYNAYKFLVARYFVDKFKLTSKFTNNYIEM